jgi:hypothetical protein
VGSPRSWLFDFVLSCIKTEATTLAIAFWHIWEERTGESEIYPNICGYGFAALLSLLFLQKLRDHQADSLDSTTGGMDYG